MKTETKLMNTPFEITKEEVLELAANKLVDAHYNSDENLSERAEKIIRNRVCELFSETHIKGKIDKALSDELEKLLGTEIIPVDIWGQRDGKPTTIRAQLADRAQRFWEVRISDDGRESSYGGTPRCEVLMKKLLKDEFEKAVASNAEVIVAEFKKALTTSGHKVVTEQIEKLVRVQTR